jgi:hypothetical protein
LHRMVQSSCTGCFSGVSAVWTSGFHITEYCNRIWQFSAEATNRHGFDAVFSTCFSRSKYLHTKRPPKYIFLHCSAYTCFGYHCT